MDLVLAELQDVGWEALVPHSLGSVDLPGVSGGPPVV